MGYLDESGLRALWEDVKKRARKDVATTSSDGLMSATDKRKLDSIEEGANAYVLPEMTEDAAGGAKLGRNLAMGDGTLSFGGFAHDSDGPVYGPIASFEAQGSATQDTTIGKNLIGIDLVGTKTTGGLTITGDGEWITITGTAEVTSRTFMSTTNGGELLYAAEGSTYTFSVVGEYTGQIPTVLLYSNNSPSGGGQISTTVGNHQTRTFATEQPLGGIVLLFNQGETYNAKFAVQLEEGSTATEYEPYTGAKPSPSPDYPQEIKVVRGHEVTGKTGRYVDLVVTTDGTTITIPIPLPSKGYAASLPDGTADTLTIDGAGKWEWTNNTDETVVDGNKGISASVNTVSTDYTYFYTGGYDSVAPTKLSAYCDRLKLYEGGGYVAGNKTMTEDVFTFAGGSYAFRACILSSIVGTTTASVTAWLKANPITILHAKKTPTIESGYVDLPDIPSEATVTCPELDMLGVSYFIDGTIADVLYRWHERVRREHDAAIDTVLSEMADLETSPASGNHSVGELIAYNGALYRVTTAIASGEQIEVGTNVTQTTLADEIATLGE